MNNVCFVGNLVRDLEKKVFDSGAVKVTGRLAVDGNKRKDGTKEVAYIPFQVWGGAAEYLYNNGAKKGSKIGISGYMISEEAYEKDGQARYPETYVKVERIDLMHSFSTAEEKPSYTVSF